MKETADLSIVCISTDESIPANTALIAKKSGEDVEINEYKMINEKEGESQD